MSSVEVFTDKSGLFKIRMPIGPWFGLFSRFLQSIEGNKGERHFLFPSTH